MGKNTITIHNIMIETLYILYGKKEVRKLYNHTLRSRLFLRAQGTSEIKFISPFFRLEIGIGQTTKKTFTFIFVQVKKQWDELCSFFFLEKMKSQ